MWGVGLSRFFHDKLNNDAFLKTLMKEASLFFIFVEVFDYSHHLTKVIMELDDIDCQQIILST